MRMFSSHFFNLFRLSALTNVEVVLWVLQFIVVVVVLCQISVSPYGMHEMIAVRYGFECRLTLIGELGFLLCTVYDQASKHDWDELAN